MKNFIIEYTCFDKSGQVIKQGVVRAKKKFNEFEAKVSFEKFLKVEHKNFGHLVIASCKEENSFASILRDAASNFWK